MHDSRVVPYYTSSYVYGINTEPERARSQAAFIIICIIVHDFVPYFIPLKPIDCTICLLTECSHQVEASLQGYIWSSSKYQNQKILLFSWR